MEIRKEDCMEDEGHQKCVIGKYFVSCPRVLVDMERIFTE